MSYGLISLQSSKASQNFSHPKTQVELKDPLMWLDTDFSFLWIIGLRGSVSAVLAWTTGLLTTWQLHSPRTSDTTEGEGGRVVERKPRKIKGRD